MTATKHAPDVEPRFARWRGRIDAATIAVAAVLLFASNVDEWIRSDDDRGPYREQRTAAAKPTPPRGLAELRTWPTAWQAWWNDRFGLRDVLLFGNGFIKARLFSVGPGPNHVIGDGGWIYWKGAEVLETWRGANPFDDDTLRSWKRRLQERRDRCAVLGAHYLFVLVPEKVTAYPEHLPSRYRKVGPSRSDQLFEALRDSGVDALDLRPSIERAKTLDRPGNTAYFEHGTHWRNWCAALATNAVLEHLRPSYPALTALPLSEYVPVPAEGLGDSEARALYLEGYFVQEEHGSEPAIRRAETLRLGGFPRLRMTRVPNRLDLPSAVVFHDSFGIYLEKPLAESFSPLTMIWSYVFDERLLEREKPAVVIEMFAERVLQTLPPDDEAPVERIEVEFERAAARFTADPRDSGRWTPMYRAAIAPANAPDDPRLIMTSFGAPDSVVLPEFDLGGRRLLVRFDVDAPAPTTLEIFFKRRGMSTYSPESKVEATLTSGRNEGIVVIPHDDLVDRLILSPGRVRGDYAIRILEVRAD